LKNEAIWLPSVKVTLCIYELNDSYKWGKLLLKVLHYNIGLFPKKQTNCVTFYVM